MNRSQAPNLCVQHAPEMIHPTALIDTSAELDSSVSIGAYSVIEAGVSIDAGTSIGSHVVIKSGTVIGSNNRIHQFNSIGDDPQDKKYAGENTRLIIGDNNTIREFCTFNRGTAQGGGVTRIGNDNWIMAYVHIAHDCQIENHTIFANNASIAGHCIIEDWVILGGFSIVHQFCRIGQHAFLSFGSDIAQSVPPYVVTACEKGRARGINSLGLQRRGYDDDTIRQIKRAYKTLYKKKHSLDERIAALQQMAENNTTVQPILDFLEKTERSFVH